MMMANADEGSSMIMDGLFTIDDGCDDVLIDLDSLLDGGEPPDPDQVVFSAFLLYLVCEI